MGWRRVRHDLGTKQQTAAELSSSTGRPEPVHRIFRACYQHLDLGARAQSWRRAQTLKPRSMRPGVTVPRSPLDCQAEKETQPSFINMMTEDKNQ